ncbi:hypothetical protein ACSSS7_003218 [Eimeria intestinalis]
MDAETEAAAAMESHDHVSSSPDLTTDCSERMVEIEAASAPAADSDLPLDRREGGAVRLADVAKRHRQGSSIDSRSVASACSGEVSRQQQQPLQEHQQQQHEQQHEHQHEKQQHENHHQRREQQQHQHHQQQQHQEQQQQQQHMSPPPEAAMPAPPVPRGCCHRRPHAHQSHRRCCCASTFHRGKASPNCSSSNSNSNSSSVSLRRRCGCRLGGCIFLLIPRKALSPGAAFLFSLLQEASPRFRCAVDMGGTLAKLVFIEELEPQSAAATAAAGAAAGSAGFARPDPQLAARVYAGNCDAALDLASPLLTIRAVVVAGCKRRDLLTGGVLRMTGGGAMKYAGLFKDQLGVSLQRTDEMDSIMAGLVLLASHTNSVFRFDLATRQRIPVDVVRNTRA